MGYEDYFLIVGDYVNYAKKHDILVGPGRGSAAGSLVSYLLGITEVDPLEYDLLFERFLNKERKTMPDIDVDFMDTRRDDVVNYMRENMAMTTLPLSLLSKPFKLNKHLEISEEFIMSKQDISICFPNLLPIR